MTDAISALSKWYERQCVNEWHEDHGIKIDTLDNPVWWLEIDLEETALENKPFAGIETHRTEDDWVVARKRGRSFEAFGGPNNLNEMIHCFLSWTETPLA